MSEGKEYHASLFFDAASFSCALVGDKGVALSPHVLLLALSFALALPFLLAPTLSTPRSLDWTAGEYAISITPQQVKTIFLEVQSIYGLNATLCRELQERYANWDESSCIGGAQGVAQCSGEGKGPVKATKRRGARGDAAL